MYYPWLESTLTTHDEYQCLWFPPFPKTFPSPSHPSTPRREQAFKMQLLHNVPALRTRHRLSKGKGGCIDAQLS
jgi:hypothetical protein